MTIVTASGLEDPAPTGPVRMTAYSVALIILGATSGLLFGYDTGVVSGAMLLIRPEFELDTLWHEFIVSGTILAACIFSFVGGYSVDRFGRRMTILVAALVFTVGAVCMASAAAKEVLLVGRVIVGMGVGLASMGTPLYLSETSAPGIRGKVVTVYNVGVTLGQFVASVVCGLFANTYQGWRWMLGLAGVPSTILLVGMIVLPESPRWLVVHGRREEAEKIILRLRGGDAMTAEEKKAVAQEVFDIQHQTEPEAEVGASVLLQILRDKKALKPMLVSCMLLGLQQLVGINTVMYYSASIIQMAGIGDSSQAIWLAVGVNFAYVAFGIVGIVLIERLGRRLLLLGSITGAMLSLFLLAAGFYIMDANSPAVSPPIRNALEAMDPCMSQLTCSGCVSSAASCGFCTFASNTTSWCLPSSGDSNGPVGASCDPAEGMVWLVGACPSSYSWLAVLGLLLYLACFAPGLGPVPWTVNSEIHPMWARGVSGSIAVSCCWIFNLLVSLTFLSLVEAITAMGAFLIYGCLASATFFLVFFFLPETKGVSLEDMDTIFDKPLSRGPSFETSSTPRP